MSLSVKTQGGGGGGLSASIFVKGLSESDVVTATKDGVTKVGEWTERTELVAVEIPVMTSNTAPSGVASASTSYANFPPYHAFNGNDSTEWNPAANSIASETYLQYEFERSVSFRSITVVTGAGAKPAYADYTYTWVMQGSVDGDIWVNISNEQTHKSGYATTLTVQSLSDAAFKYLRMQFLSSTDGYTFNEGKHGLSIDSMQVDAYYEEDASGHLISKIRDLGMWTVTATNGEKTRTQDVLIDVATEYEIEIDLYKLWLYREGDECEEVTGGWTKDGYYTSISTITAGEKNVSNFTVTAGTSQNHGQILGTANKVNLDGFSKIKAEVDVSLTTADGKGASYITITTNKANPASSDGELAYINLYTKVTGSVLEADISDFDIGAYITAISFFYDGYGANRQITVHNIWLE